MSPSTTNGASHGIQHWQPESPFLSDVPAITGATEAATSPARTFGTESEAFSPFVADYAYETGDGGASPRACLAGNAAL